MRKFLTALPMTLVAGAVLLSAPADAARKTVNDCNTEALACSQSCPATDSKCRRHCGLTREQCYAGLGRPTKVPGGGAVAVPKQPGGGVATQPKGSPKSPPIGIYQPKSTLFSTTGPAGTYHPRHDWHAGHPPQGGPTRLRSGGRR